MFQSPSFDLYSEIFLKRRRIEFEKKEFNRNESIPQLQTEMSGGNVFSRGLSRISRKKKKNRHNNHNNDDWTNSVEQNESFPQPLNSKPTLLNRSMERIRSIRRSFRKKPSSSDLAQPGAELVPGGNGGGKHDHWQPDEASVRAGTCCFNVKYLGSMEVFESRGMQVCEGALKQLRGGKRRPVKAVLYVSGDGLRVVDQENNRGLIVDQTIEKVSFCAPDRQNDKGFAYICRDGTSRRWVCHGFHASKETGERLSHAVGCAFAICLERKKKRDAETELTAEKTLNPDWDAVDVAASVTLQRTNQAYQSFRKQLPISQRLQDPQSAIVNCGPSSSANQTDSSIAKPRPAPNPALFQRQGSLRAPDTSAASQFRRNFSLRTGAGSLDSSPSRQLMGVQMLHNEPLYERDEDAMLAAMTSSYPTSEQSKQQMRQHSIPPMIQESAAIYPVMPTATVSWSSLDARPRPGPAPSPAVVPTVAAPSMAPTQQNVYINTQWENSVVPVVPVTPSQNSTRSKADEWLEDALRTSMSLTSPTGTPTHGPAPPVTPSLVTLQSNGVGHKLPNQQWSPYAAAPNGMNGSQSFSLLDSPLMSGPPPSQPPPPLPSKNAVNSALRPSPQPQIPVQLKPQIPSPVDLFGQTVQWDAQPSAPPKVDDPFDVQWSRLAVTTNNPFGEKIST